MAALAPASACAGSPVAPADHRAAAVAPPLCLPPQQGGMHALLSAALRAGRLTRRRAVRGRGDGKGVGLQEEEEDVKSAALGDAVVANGDKKENGADGHEVNKVVADSEGKLLFSFFFFF